MRIKISFLNIFLFIALAQVSFSQNRDFSKNKWRDWIKLPNADCDSAIEIKDSITRIFDVSRGFGHNLELSPTKECISCKETNSAWFKFTIGRDTTFRFDIVPTPETPLPNDYDFALFKCQGEKCIDKNGKSNLVKIRYCFSTNTSKEGLTGLSDSAKNTGVGPGKEQPEFVSSVTAKAGETYYLMINYSHCNNCMYYEGDWPSGFKIYFYNYYRPPKPIILRNVLFETNKSVLKSESFKELDKLVLQLQKSPMAIEIRGHTDNVGDVAKNQLLSEERAKAVVNYLISKNINRNRLSYKGFGSSKPIADNNTEEGRMKNRRVEFVIL